MDNLEQMRTGWDRHARAYDETITPLSTCVAEDALRFVGVEPGARLLDIAAGGGALSLPAARMQADVLAVDFSPAMVERLRDKARAQGLSNLEVRQMDGTALDLEDGSFDLACSQWGIMLFPDRRRGLAEMARVTRPGGRGMMVVFGPPAQVPLISLCFDALRMVAPEAPPVEKSPLFCLQDPDDLRDELEEAGFGDVRIGTQEHTRAFASADDLWNTVENSAPALAGLLARFPSALKANARDALAGLLQARYGHGPVELPTATHVAVGLR